MLKTPALDHVGDVRFSACLTLASFTKESKQCGACHAVFKDIFWYSGNGNGFLFHITQPTSRSTTKAIACSKPTILANIRANENIMA